MDDQQRKKDPLSSFIDYIELFAISVCIVMILFSGIFRICTVDGDSMNKTLLNGEVLVVSDMMYTPERGDIVIFHQTANNSSPDKNKPLIKRVIGLGGDTVKIDYDTWTITVTDADGTSTVLEEEYVYLNPALGNFFSGVREYEVPEGSLFVLGDNRKNSLDSRFADVGYVDERRVLGKVIIRVAPLSEFGGVD